MKCRDIERNAMRYFARDLEAKESMELLVHVDSCLECKRAFHSQQELNNLLKHAVLDQELDTSSLERQILSRIGEHQLQEKRMRFSKAIQLASAAAVIVLAIGLGLFYATATKELRLYAAAFQDHHVEVTENARRQWTFQPNLISQLGVQATGGPITIAPVSLQGYVLTRGKICLLQNRPYLHLVYKNERDEISVFLTRADIGFASASLLRYSSHYLDEQRKNIGNIAEFRQGSLLFLVVSTQPNEDLPELAKRAAQQLKS